MREILNRYIISEVEEPFKMIFTFLEQNSSIEKNFMQPKYICVLVMQSAPAISVRRSYKASKYN